VGEYRIYLITANHHIDAPNTRSIFEHGPDHRLQITRRCADDLKQSLERQTATSEVPQFVEQPSVLDGYDSLSCKALH
jgi:hypothetical protein